MAPRSRTLGKSSFAHSKRLRLSWWMFCPDGQRLARRVRAQLRSNAGPRVGARVSLMPDTAIPTGRELFCEERAEQIDALGSKAAGWRDPVNCTGWKLPFGEDQFETTLSERVTQKKLRKNAERQTGGQNGDHGIAVVCAQAPRGAHGYSLTLSVPEVPRVRHPGAGVRDALVFRQFKGVGGLPVLFEVRRSTHQKARHRTKCARDERRIR